MKCSQTTVLLLAVFLTARCDNAGEGYESGKENQLMEGQTPPENQPGRGYYPNNIQQQYFPHHHRYNMHQQPTTQQHNIQDYRPAAVGPSSNLEESHITKLKETEKGPETEEEDQDRPYQQPKLPSNIPPQMMIQQKTINAGGPIQNPRINPQSMQRNQMEQQMMMHRPMRLMAVPPQPFMNQPYMNHPPQQPHQPFMNHPPQQPHQPFMNHPPQQPHQPFMNHPPQQPHQPFMNHPPQQPHQPFMNHPPQQPHQPYMNQQPHISPHYTQQTQQMKSVPQHYISQPPHQPQKEQPPTGPVIQNADQPGAATKQRYASQPWQQQQRYPPYEGYEPKA